MKGRAGESTQKRTSSTKHEVLWKSNWQHQATINLEILSVRNYQLPVKVMAQLNYQAPISFSQIKQRVYFKNKQKPTFLDKNNRTKVFVTRKAVGTNNSKNLEL